MLRADIIRQPEMIPNSGKQAGPQIAARFLNEIERIPIGLVKCHTGKSKHDDRLRFVVRFGHTLQFAGIQTIRVCGWLPRCRSAARQGSVRFGCSVACFHPGTHARFNGTLHLGGVDVSVDREDTVRRPDQSTMMLSQGVGIQTRYRRLRSKRIQSVPLRAEQVRSKRSERRLDELIPLRLDGRQLTLALSFDCRRRKGGIQQDIQNQIDPQFIIVLQYLSACADTVVSRKGVQ